MCYSRLCANPRVGIDFRLGGRGDTYHESRRLVKHFRKKKSEKNCTKVVDDLRPLV